METARRATLSRAAPLLRPSRPLSDLLVVFRAHVVFEEEQIVPALERAMSESELIALENAMADEYRIVASAFRELARARPSAA